MDIPGFVLICAAVICWSLALQGVGVERAWSASYSVGLLVGAGLLVIAFALDQWYQGERALLTTSFLKNRALLVGAIFEFL
jgi:hypothetical protein